MDCKTIRDIVVYSAETYGDQDAIRYKAGNQGKGEQQTK